MYKAIKGFLLLLTMAIGSRVGACACPYLEELSEKDLQQYNYIALVKINAIISDETTGQNSGVGSFVVRISELLHFKGKSYKELLVAGGHEKSSVKTSCDLGMAENQQWIIFSRGLYKGRPTVSFCDRNILYRTETGVRDWYGQGGFRELRFLSHHFGKDTSVLETRRYVPGRNGFRLRLLYENGSIEKTVRYQNATPVSYTHLTLPTISSV